MPREAEAPSAVKVLMRIPDLTQPKTSGGRPAASEPAVKASPSAVVSMALPLAYLDDIAPGTPATVPPKAQAKPLLAKANLESPGATERDWPYFDHVELAERQPSVPPASHPPAAPKGTSRTELPAKFAGDTNLLDVAVLSSAVPKPAGMQVEAKPPHKPLSKPKYLPDPEEIITPDERKRHGSQPLVLLGALAIIICVLVVALIRNRNARPEQPALNRPAAPAKGMPKLEVTMPSPAPSPLAVTAAPPTEAAPAGPQLGVPLLPAVPAEITIERLPPLPEEGAAPPVNEARGAAPPDAVRPGVAQLQNRIDKTPTDRTHDATRRRF